MRPEWKDWVSQLKADGKFIQLHAIVRGLEHRFVMNVPFDVSADAFAMAIRQSPDAAGTPLAQYSVTVDSYADGITPVRFSLPTSETGEAGDLPADTGGRGVLWLPFDIIHTPNAAPGYRCAGGLIAVSGAIA